MFKHAVDALEVPADELHRRIAEFPDCNFKKNVMCAQIFTDAIRQQINVGDFTTLLEVHLRELHKAYHVALYLWIIKHGQPEYLLALLAHQQQKIDITLIFTQNLVHVPFNNVCIALITYIISSVGGAENLRSPLLDTIYQYLVTVLPLQDLPDTIATFLAEYRELIAPKIVVTRNSRVHALSGAVLTLAEPRYAPFGEYLSTFADRVPISSEYILTGELVKHMHSVMPETRHLNASSLARYLLTHERQMSTHQQKEWPIKWYFYWSVVIKNPKS